MRLRRTKRGLLTTCISRERSGFPTAVFAVCLALASALHSTPVGKAFGQSGDSIVIVVAEGESVRQISEKYLGDPDLWPIILRANNLQDITDLTSGQSLTLPVSEIQAAKQSLAVSLTEIQSANHQGAQLFAPKLIETAIGYRDEALAKHNGGSWSETLSLANLSLASAASARQVSEKNRDQSAEARLNDRQGWVEGQRPEELLWSDRKLNAILREEEKIRTLSRSTAQVVFRDASRLRLNANSQAVIQRIRFDPLKRREEAEINLVTGDFYAILGAESSRNRLEVQLPNVDAKIDSGDFWVSHDRTGAKFTNYDSRPVTVSAGGETIELGRNQGAFVRDGTAASEKFDVKPATKLVSPRDDQTIYGRKIQFKWEPVDDASAYWIEIAFDHGFDRMRESRWGIAESTVQDIELAPGTYYWRIAALDAFGLPGNRSKTGRFDVEIDDAPPFLEIRTPSDSQILRQPAYTISGEAEPGVRVTVNGQPTEIDKDGRFALQLIADEGVNDVVVAATDAAGNATERTVRFQFMPDRNATVAYEKSIPRIADRHFLTGGDKIRISGVAAGNAQFIVKDGSGTKRVSTRTDKQGQFAVSLPLFGEAEDFEVSVILASGYSYRDSFRVELDKTPPQLRHDETPPRLASSPELKLRGEIDSDAELTLNGELVNLEDRRFNVVLQLIPGPNLFQLVATDKVGNVTVEKWIVTLDREAPEVVDRRIDRKDSGDGQFLTVLIKARDASGLAKTAPFRVFVADKVFPGMLRYNRATKSYQGGLRIPGLTKGLMATALVELTDDAGNTKSVELN